MNSLVKVRELDPAYKDWFLKVGELAGDIATYSDHQEHVEPADRDSVIAAGATLRSVGVEMANHEGLDPLEIYANRIGVIERKNVLWTPSGYQGNEEVLKAKTWRDLQLAQIGHDREYHPDVVGMSRYDQLRHHAFHASKLAGDLALRASKEISPEAFNQKTLPDTLIFGVVIATVMREFLPETPINN